MSIPQSEYTLGQCVVALCESFGGKVTISKEKVLSCLGRFDLMCKIDEENGQFCLYTVERKKLGEAPPVTVQPEEYVT